MAEITFGQAVKAAIADAFRADPRVVHFGEDIAHHGGMFRVTDGLLAEFGESRIFDTPISESGFIGMGLGAAMTGLRPVIELMFFDFSLVAMDQLLNQVAKTHAMSGGTVPVPLTIRTQGGGYKGAAAQHSQMLEALFLHVPGFCVVCPATPADAYGLLTTCIHNEQPCLFVEHKQLYGVSGEFNSQKVPLGKARVARSGSSCTLISYSWSVHLCLEAAEKLALEGVEVEVIDLRCLQPLDFAAVEVSVAKTHRVGIVHESHLRCGPGVDLAARIQRDLFDELDAPVHFCCGLDVPIPLPKALEDEVLPTPSRIEAMVRELMR